MDFHFATAFETVADSFPNRIATIADGRELSWGNFERRAASIAGLLHAHGIGADAKAGLYHITPANTKKPNFKYLRWVVVRSM